MPPKKGKNSTSSSRQDDDDTLLEIAMRRAEEARAALQPRHSDPTTFLGARESIPEPPGTLPSYVMTPTGAPTDIGVEVVVHSKYGRVLVARRAFRQFDVVLQEAPLLTYCGIEDGTRKYLQLSACSRAVIDSMQANELPANLARDVNMLAARTGLPIEVMTHFCKISNTNAHQMLGRQEGGVADVNKQMSFNQIMGLEAETMSALFDKGSKVRHSCIPNCTYTTKRCGLLEYIALCDLLPGDEITFSYTDVNASQNERKDTLLFTKQFVCDCPRCVDADDTSAMRCPQCHQGSLLQGASYFSCTRCGHVLSSLLSYDALVEKQRETKLAVETMTMPMAVMRLGLPEALRRFSATRKQLLCLFGATHNSILKLLEEESRVHASLAARESNSLKAAPHLKSSARLSMAQVKLLECRASRCFACDLENYTAGYNHPVSYTAEYVAFIAICDFAVAYRPTKGKGKNLHPEDATHVAKLRNYLPFWRLTYGEDDHSVRDIEDFFDATSNEGNEAKDFKALRAAPTPDSLADVPPPVIVQLPPPLKKKKKKK